MPSVTPSQSAQPSSMPSLVPSESSQPSSMPSLVPTPKTISPSLMPSLLSLTPSLSGQPSSEPSYVPSESLQPSSEPSLVPSESSQPSSMPTGAPSASGQPSGAPSGAPSASGQPSGAPSSDPSASGEPSGAPSSTRDKLMKSLVLTVSSEDALNNKGSPQEEAFLWVTTEDHIDPPLQPGTDDDAQIIQRYILAVFYYATNGDGWDDNGGWLGSSNECYWINSNVYCHGGGDDMVTALLPSGNNLVGSIPTELGKLGRLELLDLNNNQLTGGIPTELGQLLTGGIPTELGQLVNLERLYLDGNQLSGSIPTELKFLGSLEQLVLNNNTLSGGIPIQLLIALFVSSSLPTHPPPIAALLVSKDEMTISMVVSEKRSSKGFKSTKDWGDRETTRGKEGVLM
eukprot:scaffold1834_cov73-Skeletonema_dohrnii-CCMP3373.AAC.1